MSTKKIIVSNTFVNLVQIFCLVCLTQIYTNFTKALINEALFSKSDLLILGSVFYMRKKKVSSNSYFIICNWEVIFFILIETD